MQELTPNTIEWYKWRCEGIGASDSPVIMGNSEFKTKLELWDEKFNKTIPTDKEREKSEFVCNQGHRLEAWARPGIEFETGLTWQPATFTHKTFEFLRATLDGWNSQVMEVWECKYISKVLFEILSDESLKTEDRIPKKYFDQLMHQLFVTGAKRLRLTGVMQWKDECGHWQKKAYTLDIDRTPEHDKYINEILIPALFEFWKSIQEGKRPEVEKKDVLNLDNKELRDKVFEYKELKNEEKDLKGKAKKESEKILGNISDRVSNLKDFIFSHPARNHEKMDIEGFKLIEVSGKEAINYKDALNSFFDWITKIKALSPGEIVQSINSFPDKPSLEKYTTAGKPSLRITVPKEKKEKDKIEKKIIKTIKVGDIEHTETTIITEPITTKERLTEWKSATPEQQKILAESNSFKHPDTKKKPRGWTDKTREERIEYLKKPSKKTSEQAKKIMLDLANELENLNEMENKETIGGITFE